VVIESSDGTIIEVFECRPEDILSSAGTKWKHGLINEKTGEFGDRLVSFLDTTS
jgi:hypothetical protein